VNQVTYTMYWQDNTRRDNRSYGRGTSLVTVLSKVTILESYRMFIEGEGWIAPNSYTDLPLNTEIFLTLAENGDSRFLVDWLWP